MTARKTRLVRFVVATELSKELAAAKDKIRAAVDGHVATKLAEALKSALGLR